MLSPSRSAWLAGLLITAGATSACGADDSDDGAVQVVASTNAWGSVVQAIGGGDVEVTSLIADPATDPHSFEANPRTQLAVSKADVIVENGGGYDDFMSTLTSSSGSDAEVIDAVEVSGKDTSTEDFNEHVWYDLPTVAKVGDRIAQALSEADPAHADTYTANEAAFHQQLDALVSAESDGQQKIGGAGVAITEPVPLYLLDALGAVNETPAAFSEAIEEGDDVSPAVLRDTLALFSDGTVRALVYNAQTTGAETERVLAAAEDADVPVVPVTETLPEGDDYTSWMQQNIAAVVTALGS